MNFIFKSMIGLPLMTVSLGAAAVAADAPQQDGLKRPPPDAGKARPVAERPGQVQAVVVGFKKGLEHDTKSGDPSKAAPSKPFYGAASKP